MSNPYEIASAFGRGAQGFIQGMQDAENRKMKQMELEALQKARDDEFERNKLMDAINMRKAGLMKNESGELVDTPQALEDRQFEKQLRNAQLANLRMPKGEMGKPVVSSPLLGFSVAPDAELDPTSKRQLRAAQGSLVSFNSALDQLAEQVKGASRIDLANPYSDTRKGIEQNLKDLQLIYKNEDFAKLGVLTGPDLEILEKVIENPGSISNLISGKKGVIDRYQKLRDRTNKNFEEKAASFGLERTSPVEVVKYDAGKNSGGLLSGILDATGLLKSAVNSGQTADASNQKPKIRVRKGKEVLLIDPSDAADAVKDGYEVLK